MGEIRNKILALSLLTELPARRSHGCLNMGFFKDAKPVLSIFIEQAVVSEEAQSGASEKVLIFSLELQWLCLYEVVLRSCELI